MKDNKKILLVDDEKLYLEVLSKALTKFGYEVSVALNGKEALEIFNKKHFDLVITDMVMPEINGVDLLKEIKSISTETEVIVITGYGESESYLESMTLGASEYLNKPINMFELKKNHSQSFFPNLKIANY